MAVRKAVIPAAGLGTRFLPATKAMPKEMLPIVDKPMIQYVVEEAVAAGIDDVLIITGRGKRAIEDHFDRAIELEGRLESEANRDLLHLVRSVSDLVNIHFIRQREARGLGDAVLHGWQHVGDEPFAVLLGDELFTGDAPCLRELIDQYERLGPGVGGVIAVQAVAPADVSRYGIIRPEPVRSRLHRVRGLVEKPQPEQAPSNLAIVGRYVLDAAIFERLRTLAPGHGNEIQLTDALDGLANGLPLYAYEIEAERYDVGNQLGYIKAMVSFALAREGMAPDLARYLREVLADRGASSCP